MAVLRTLGLSVLLCLPVLPAAAQTFFAVPAPLLAQEVAPEQATECFIYFANPSGNTLRLRWKTVDTSSPAAWDIDLCDFGACYTGIPGGGLMNTVSGATQPYLKLIAQPGAVTGNGWLWFRVYADGHPENFQDVFFSLYSPGVTAIQEIPAAAVRVFPNPSSAQFFLENNTEQSVDARIYNTFQEEKWMGVLPANSRVSIDAAPWPAGIYWLQTPERAQLILHLN